MASSCWPGRCFFGHGTSHEPKPSPTNNSFKDATPPAAHGKEYEVFLSFRGPDTRRGFADCLYVNMRDVGVRVFRDNEELRVGNEIGPGLRRGIENSRISIPIFSKGYAQSKWCLKELSLIVECSTKGDQLIMPIFYDVTPDEVKHQTGRYKEALRQHGREYPDCVKQWSSCLSEVGRLKGWVLKDIADGHEGQLIKLVVTTVLRKLKKFQLPMTKYLVGVDRHANNILSLLDVGTSDVRMVGIYGLSGSGKTTLAKYVYNKLLNDSEYEGHCSLDNIHERCPQISGLEQLQSKLVADLTQHEHRGFFSVDAGIDVLENSFRDKRVLILLDDVGHARQLKALVGECEWFGPGSRIIATTTDGCIFRDAPQLHSCYEIGAMEPHEALELFSKHAFRNDSSADLYTARLNVLAKEMVKAMGGLPLALEIIGSFLYGRSEEQWREMLEKLKVRADNRVLNKLRITFDDLEDEYKEIFLDVACFFIGMDVRVATHMWKDCNFFPEVGIEVLRLRSLIKVGEDKRLWMHNALRDLGRKIVQQEDKSIERRSRLWRHEEAMHVLRKREGTENIKAMSLSTGHPFLGEQLEKMSSLRYLRLDNGLIMGTLPPLSELRWLRLQNHHRFEYTTADADFPFSKLKILDLSRNNITAHCWSRWVSPKKPAMLKVLDLSGSKELRETPDLSMFPYLERLILEGCGRLLGFHSSMIYLQSLSSLNLKGCRSLFRLPDEIGSLRKLEELIIDETSILYLPKSIIALENLQKLSAKDCYNLTTIPEKIGSLQSLVELSLTHTKLQSLPDSVGNLEKLEILDISLSKISHFPNSLWNLRKLKVINAAKCEYLTGDIPFELGKLCSLEVLRLDSTKVSRIPETIVGLSRLQILDLTACPRLQTLPELPVSLVTLRMACESAKAILNLSDLINLEELVWRTSVSSHIFCLTKFQYVQEFPKSLQKLNLLGSHLRVMPSVSNLTNLSMLHLERCYDLVEIPSLVKLVSLRSLKVRWCPQITSLFGLESLMSLRVLEVISCEKIDKLPDLSKLHKLAVLNTRGCESLVTIQGLSRLYSLTDVDIGDCKRMKTLPNLSKLRLLRTLIADGCEELIELKGVGELEELLSLGISGCRKICLPDLSKLTKLRYLNIVGCEGISEVRGLLKMKSLNRVVICKHASLKKLRELPRVCDLIDPQKLSQGSAPAGDGSSVKRGVTIALNDSNIIAMYPFEKERGSAPANI